MSLRIMDVNDERVEEDLSVVRGEWRCGIYTLML